MVEDLIETLHLDMQMNLWHQVGKAEAMNKTVEEIWGVFTMTTTKRLKEATIFYIVGKGVIRLETIETVPAGAADTLEDEDNISCVRMMQNGTQVLLENGLTVLCHFVHVMSGCGAM